MRKKTRTPNNAKQTDSSEDIVKLILEDHKPLKVLIKIMKDSENSFSQRRKAFEKFAPLLISHAKPEEQVLYGFMKDEEDLREEAFEGDVEHSLADEMIESVKATSDKDECGAKIKVLAELVEHHIEEEESELLPDFKKHADAEERMELGAEYRAAKDELDVQEYEDDSGNRKIKNRDVSASVGRE